jgi:hypothetical protein
MMYALPLESPPLLVVSDRLKIEVHTHFTGTPSERHVFALEDITRPEVQQRLRTLWTEPEAWRPKRSNREITEEAARTFASTAERLRSAGVAPERVSHFLTQCVFSFFAEDVGLLPVRLFERLVGVQLAPEVLRDQLAKLFETMRSGGLFGVEAVPWFNGGLFAKIDVPPLAAADVAALKAASALNWSAIDPSIFGTLFERGLDPAKRSQLGAHYTDPATIMRLVEPVVQRPLLAECAERKTAIAVALAKSKKHGDKAYRDAQAAFVGHLERLKAYRVLDPACGSGNFLYLALKTLKDIEHQANFEAEALGLERQHDVTGPHNDARHRAERVRRRAGARHGVDRRVAMAARQGLWLQDAAGAGAAGSHRVQRCGVVRSPLYRRVRMGPPPFGLSLSKPRGQPPMRWSAIRRSLASAENAASLAARTSRPWTECLLRGCLVQPISCATGSRKRARKLSAAICNMQAWSRRTQFVVVPAVPCWSRSRATVASMRLGLTSRG